MTEQLAVTPEYQALILAEALQNPQFKDLLRDTVTAEMFADKALQFFFDTITQAPITLTKKTLKEELYKAAEAKKIRKEEIERYKEVFKAVKTPPSQAETEHIKATLTGFIRTQAMKKAILDSFDLVKNGEWDKAEQLVSEAANKGVDLLSAGHDYFSEFLERLDARDAQDEQHSLPTGIMDLDNQLNGGLKPKQFGLVIGSSGRGKCQTFDTPILMFDGTIKPVQDVREGDLLMGPDSLPRKVLALGGGVGDIYTIHPTKGDPWGCNYEHVLTLVNSSGRYGKKGDIIDIPLCDYMGKSATFKNTYKLFSVGVDFQPHKTALEVDPYFLGVWLGDGAKTTDKIGITKGDLAIENVVRATAEKWGLRYRKYIDKRSKCPSHHITGEGSFPSAGPLKDALKTCVTKDWGISHRYLTGSREERLQLLAGLVDTDGYLRYGGFEIFQKHKPLADSIAFLARSLGFKVTTAEKYCKSSKTSEVHGPYYKCMIIGDCHTIPTRIARKKASPRKQIKKHNRTGFTVTKGAPARYYGFTLDGDGRYLMGDFTVTHNTLLLSWLARTAALLYGKTVFYFTLEMTAEDIASRFDSMITRVRPKDLKDTRQYVEGELTPLSQKYAKKLFIKEFVPGTTTVSAFVSYVKNMAAQGIVADLVILDYLDLIKPARSYDNPNQEMNATCVAICGLAKECNTRVWSATQLNRGGIVNDNPDETHIAGAIDKLFTVDVAITMAQTKAEREDKEMRLILTKSRNGGAGKSVKIETDFDFMTFYKAAIAMDKEKTQDEEDEEARNRKADEDREDEAAVSVLRDNA